MRREAKRVGVFTRRALLLGGAQLTALGLLGAKLYHVQVVDGVRYATLAETNRVNTRLIAPPRGRLLDRFGTTLAGNDANWRALIVAEQTDDANATLDNFSRIVPLADHERVRIERELHRHRRFIPVTIREFLSWEDMARIEVNAPDLPGILVDVGATRRYPFGPALAHVIGYVAPPSEADANDDPMLSLPGIRVGRAGVEKYHDLALRGRAGAVQLEINALGRVIRELDRQEGTPGAEITLSIDAELQQQVIARLGDESASAVVMDARNGEVLAMATNPSFDPSLFNSGVSQAQWIEWTSDRQAPLINKAAAGLYAPGSTFKMVVALAGLEAKALSPSDRINCPGYLDFGDTRFHCWKKGGHGSLDLRGGLKNSCDVFFYEVARRTGMDHIAAMANRFGLGVPLATMAARIATGRAVQPHLTRAIGGVVQSGIKAEDWPSMGLPEAELRAVREGMWAVVNEPGGTATIAKLIMPGVQLAGKTGSSQVRRVSREQREHGFKSENLPWEFRPHALFVAFAPYDAPKYALAVVVEHGNAGATMAGPIARDIMTDVLTRDPVSRHDAPPPVTAENFRS